MIKVDPAEAWIGAWGRRIVASSLHRALERLNFFRSVTSRFSRGCLRAAYSD
jgi:hypothetical protein